jgi:hypothetical protein
MACFQTGHFFMELFFKAMKLLTILLNWNLRNIKSKTISKNQ